MDPVNGWWRKINMEEAKSSNRRAKLAQKIQKKSGQD